MNPPTASSSGPVWPVFIKGIADKMFNYRYMRVSDSAFVSGRRVQLKGETEDPPEQLNPWHNP